MNLRHPKLAANLSELELKKILIDKMESNKSIHISDEQKNLYKELVDAYESDKLILDTYGDTISFKRRQDDEDKDEEPSDGSNRGSKRRRAGKEPESTSAPKDKTSKTTGKSTEGSKYHHKSADKSAQAEEPMHTAEYLEEPAHQDTLAQKEDTRESFNELMDTPLDFSAFVMNRLKVDTLTPELLAGPSFELMKGSCKSLNVESKCRLATQHSTPALPGILSTLGRNDNNTMILLLTGICSRCLLQTQNYWLSQSFQIVEWHNYKHLDWITVRKDDDKLYKFKEERLAFNVSLRMFTRSIVIQRHVEDLQLGVESYQKKLNLTKSDTLMHIDELHKFSDGTLNDVQTALDDRLKGIRMKFYTSAGNPVKDILLKLNLPDHRILKDGCEVKEFQRSFHHSDTERLSRSDEVLKLKNLKKDALLKLFKFTYQERYEHVGPEVTSSQDGKVYKMAKRDYAWLMISRCSRLHFHIQVKIKEQAQT
ncbi:hypothetical protein Tco_0709654 [Tanacetum coccineum]